MTRTRRIINITEKRSPWAALIWRLALLFFVLIVFVMILPWLMIAAAVAIVAVAVVWAIRRWNRRGLARA